MPRFQEERAQERKEWEAKLQQARTEEAEAGAKRCASMAEKADALKRQHANEQRPCVTGIGHEITHAADGG